MGHTKKSAEHFLPKLASTNKRSSTSTIPFGGELPLPVMYVSWDATALLAKRRAKTARRSSTSTLLSFLAASPGHFLRSVHLIVVADFCVNVHYTGVRFGKKPPVQR
jgi:hypothetical protein